MVRSAQEQLQFTLFNRILSLLESEQLDALRELILEAHPADIAQMIGAIPREERETFWQLVPDSISGDILQDLDNDVRAELLAGLETEKVIAMTQGMDTDDFADVLQDIPDQADEILEALDEDRRKRLQAILSFPEDVAGGVMDLEVITVRSDVQISVVQRYLRKIGALPDGTDKLFVTDRSGRFLGHLSLSLLVVSDVDLMVGEIMRTEVPSVTVETSVEDVAELFVKLDLISIAVLDEKKRLVGRITVDDIVDFIKEAGQRQLMRFTGAVNENIFAPVFDSARRRMVWLGVNLLTAFLAAWIIGIFEPTIEKLTALAVLMPIVASMGGIAGSQTLTLIIRSSSMGQLQKSTVSRVLQKEMLVGLLNGILWATVIASVTWLWFDDLILSIVIGAAIITNLLVAAISAVFIPLFLNRIGVDPALAGGVILTTVTDVVGFIAFLGLATIWLF